MMLRIKTQSVFALFALSLYAPIPYAYAQDSSTPIEITAEKSLEWHRNDLKFIARQNAIATQNLTSVKGDTLTALYRSSATSDIDIYEMIADGTVEVQNETSTAYGDRAVYDVEKQFATLTGEDLKLVSPDQTITAQDRFTYDAAKRKASASGNAFVKRAGDTVRADTITAIFKENSASAPNENKQAQGIERMDAVGNVIITTPEEVLTGDRAVYLSATNTAEITGNVKITRGPNILEGAKATVDLGTNISKMYGASETGERVRGVFYPKSKSQTQTPANESESE